MEISYSGKSPEEIVKRHLISKAKLQKVNCREGATYSIKNTTQIINFDEIICENVQVFTLKAHNHEELTAKIVRSFSLESDEHFKKSKYVKGETVVIESFLKGSTTKLKEILEIL
jgi:hypothetical protein